VLLRAHFHFPSIDGHLERSFRRTQGRREPLFQLSTHATHHLQISLQVRVEVYGSRYSCSYGYGFKVSVLTSTADCDAQWPFLPWPSHTKVRCALVIPSRSYNFQHEHNMSTPNSNPNQNISEHSPMSPTNMA